MRIAHLCVGMSILAIATPAPADPVDAISATLCTLARNEERLDLEVYELEVARADSRFVAAEQIFGLVDKLWKDELIERITHLAAKHDRDVAQLDFKRQQLLLKRQEAVVEIYESVCSGSSDEKSITTRLDAAQREYARNDCHRVGKELAIAEADMAFSTEWLASIVDLRENGVATAQDVIRAEEDVDIALREIRYHTPRVEACKASGAAAGEGD